MRAEEGEMLPHERVSSGFQGDEDEQGKNILYSRCMGQDKACSLILDRETKLTLAPLSPFELHENKPP